MVTNRKTPNHTSIFRQTNFVGNRSEVSSASANALHLTNDKSKYALNSIKSYGL
jgi:hypothetical protein